MQGQVCAHVIGNQVITQLGDWLKVISLVSGIAETWTQVVWLKGSLQSQVPHYKFQSALAGVTSQAWVPKASWLQGQQDSRGQKTRNTVQY